MRPVTIFNLGGINDPAVRAALEEITRASQENDLVTIAQNFTISGSYTETRELDVATPTAANIAAVLATFIADCQRGGSKRAN